MATTLIASGVSIDEYLSKSYRPDVEYIDGVLKERPVVTKAHGRLQSLISIWFGNHEETWPIEVAVEVRTRVSTERVRLPDVVIYKPGVKTQFLIEPPLIVIEILSPDDSYTETQRLALDYQNMGVQNIWLIDPETRTGKICQGENWIGVRRFEVPDTPIYMDLDELFARLDPSIAKP